MVVMKGESIAAPAPWARAIVSEAVLGPSKRRPPRCKPPILTRLPKVHAGRGTNVEPMFAAACEPGWRHLWRKWDGHAAGLLETVLAGNSGPTFYMKVIHGCKANRARGRRVRTIPRLARSKRRWSGTA